jgi:benzoyl-CoA reductase/2-hydroxyglutaryl-CoA dehydratase subunit BcrC/BadD/HgdB
MKDSIAVNNIRKIFEIEGFYEKIINDYKNEYEKKIIVSPYFFIPPEINAAFNIVTLKIPEFMLNQSSIINREPPPCGRGTNLEFMPNRHTGVGCKSDNLIVDMIVISDGECFCNENIKSMRHYIFKTPEGFGEDAAVALHNEISLMLNTLFGIDIKSINIEALQRETAVYENLRRLIRNIVSLHYEAGTILSNEELSLIFETALVLPPEIAIQYINPVLEEIKMFDNKHDAAAIKSLLYGKKYMPHNIADAIERMGILIIEDDLCTGRRSVDLSLNSESEYIFYEMLDAYSYRALFPCLRPVSERYELIYKLLKNYNIDCVIFYKDEDCFDLSGDIDYLKIKLMRDGIDQIVIDKVNYEGIVSEYVERNYPCNIRPII